MDQSVQRRVRLPGEPCSSKYWLQPQVSRASRAGGCPPTPCLSQGVIFGSLSRLVLPRPRELTGSKKAPRQSLMEESWHIQFRKVSLSVTRAQDVRKEGRRSLRRCSSEEAELRGRSTLLGGPGALALRAQGQSPGRVSGGRAPCRARGLDETVPCVKSFASCYCWGCTSEQQLGQSPRGAWSRPGVTCPPRSRPEARARAREPRSRQAGPPGFGFPQPQLSSLLDWELFVRLGAGEGTCPRRRENLRTKQTPSLGVTPREGPPSPFRTWAGQGRCWETSPRAQSPVLSGRLQRGSLPCQRPTGAQLWIGFSVVGSPAG